jgi:hypothetical protein
MRIRLVFLFVVEAVNSVEVAVVFAVAVNTVEEAAD